MLAGVFIATSLALSVAGYFSYGQQVRAIRAERADDLQAVSSLKVGALAAWRTERLADARVASGGLSRAAMLAWLAAPGDAARERAARDNARLVAESHGYRNVILVGQDGRIRMSLDPRVNQLQPAGRELVARVLRERRPRFGDLFRCPICHEIHLDVAAPILDEGGRAVAVLILRADPARFIYPIIRSWPTPIRTAETLLLQREGDSVLFLAVAPHRPVPALTLRLPLAARDLVEARAARGEVGLISGEDYREVAVVADVRPVADFPWIMVSKMDTAEVLTEARARGWIILGFVLLGIVLVAVALAFIAYAGQAGFYRELFRATRVGEAGGPEVPEAQVLGARRLAMVLAGAAVAIGATALLGWWLDIPILKSGLPGYITMKVNTAVGIVLAGVATMLLGCGRVARRWSLGFAIAVAFLGLFTLLEFVLPVSFGLDQFLAVEPPGTNGVLPPGRMAALSAAGFLLLGTAIGLTGLRRTALTAQRLAVVVGGMALLELLAYSFGATNLSGFGLYLRMAVHTAAAFALLGLAVPLSRPSEGLVRTLLGQNLGGWLLRRLAPVLLLVLPLLGWLTSYGAKRGYLEGPFAVAFLVAMLVLMLGAAIWWVARALTRIDAVRLTAEMRATEGAEEIRATLYGIGDGVVTTDANGRVARLNPVAERLTGWSEAEAQGRPLGEVFRIVNETTGKPAETPVERVLREGRVVGLANHTALVARDGTVRPIMDSGAPIRLGTGRIGGVVLVFRDQTEERAARAAVSRATANFAVAFQGSPVAMVITSPAGRVADVNDVFLRESGYARDELIGRSTTELGVFTGEADRERMLDALRSRGFVNSLEMTLRRKSGEPRTCLLSAALLQTGKEPHLLSTIVDITERKQAEEQLQAGLAETRRLLQLADQSRRALLSIMEDQKRQEEQRKELENQLTQVQKMESIGRLAGGVAHDFNNMLSIILGYAQMARRKLTDASPAFRDLEQITEAGNRAAGLTRQLLAFSRRQVLQPVPLSLNDSVTGLTKMLQRILGEDVEVNHVLAADLGVVRADPGQIEQVIMNLVVNARDAMPRGGKLTIETSNADLDQDYASRHLGLEAGPYVRLAITDTGVGMDEVTRARVFEPFFTTKEKGKGTGLGMSTVYGIVKQSGGGIWIYSEPGRGTTVKVYLPRESGSAAAAPAAPASVGRTGGTETILVVEDEAALRDFVVISLQEAGYRVLAADGGEAAVRVSAEHAGEIHLLLTDVVLPHMSGRELAGELERLRPTTKVLYTSGYTDDAIIHHGALIPGTNFISKPISVADLLRKVREVLDGPGPTAAP